MIWWISCASYAGGLYHRFIYIYIYIGYYEYVLTDKGSVSLRRMMSQLRHILNLTQNKSQWNTDFETYGFKTLCEISKEPFEISHNTSNPYTAKYAFYKVLNILQITISSISYRYDILEKNKGPVNSIGQILALRRTGKPLPGTDDRKASHGFA